MIITSLTTKKTIIIKLSHLASSLSSSTSTSSQAQSSSTTLKSPVGDKKDGNDDYSNNVGPDDELPNELKKGNVRYHELNIHYYPHHYYIIIICHHY